MKVTYKIEFTVDEKMPTKSGIEGHAAMLYAEFKQEAVDTVEGLKVEAVESDTGEVLAEVK